MTITSPSYSTFSSNGNTASTKLPNGAYDYNISSDNTSWAAPNGTFTVSGAAVGVSVIFTPVTYTMTFTESNLPLGDSWYVNITHVSGMQNAALSSTGATTTLTANLSNGTYTFKVATNDKRYAPSYYTMDITVTGANESFPTVDFTPVTYTVTFTAKNLPPAPFEWFVNITGQASLNNSTGKTITTALMNGTYTYKIGTSNLSWAGKGGSLVVNGGTVSKTVTFSLVVFTVEATETGLPSGYEWGFDITSVSSFGSTGSTIITSLPNGTYPYTIESTNTSWASPAGSFTVNGAGVIVSVPFTMVTYTVTFTESNLPSGDSWYVNVTALTGTGSPLLSTSGATTTLATNLPNGTYTFTVASSDKTWAPSYYTGSFTVDGAEVSTSNVAFALLTYTVTFTESGLPAATEWFVNLTGGGSYNSMTDTIVFSEPNGTYDYTFGSANTNWAASGHFSFKVNGGPVPETVTFVLVTYTMTFTETGLPTVGAGVSQWWVNLTNSQSFTSTTNTISFVEPNGTYHYSIETVAKRVAATYGLFTVHGAIVSVPVSFTPVKLSVTFAGTGLPSSKSWFVVLNGTMMTPTGGSVMTNVVNGTYPYIIGGPAGYRVMGAAQSGALTVNGASVWVNFTFAKGATYPIHFSESGLPKGQSWCVVLGSWEKCSTTKSAAYLNLTPGSYVYTVLPMTGQTITAKVGGLAVPLSGTLGIAVKGISVVLKYVYPYFITFTESGLPSGNSWSVTMKGVMNTTSTSSIGFALPNGTYGFKVGAVTGYTYTVSSHSAKVVGGPVTITVTFRPKPTHGGSPSMIEGAWDALVVNALRVGSSVGL